MNAAVFVVSRAKTPVACVVGGGYDRNREQLASRHAVVHLEAAKVWREKRMYKR